jgi:hypothetical protein
MSAPAVITQYLAAAAAEDFGALADCFTALGTVTDEGHTYRGRAEILGWRESVASQWTYTSTVTSSEPINDDEYRVTVHVVGNFPGGAVDLTYRFVLQDNLIADLTIGE